MDNDNDMMMMVGKSNKQKSKLIDFHVSIAMIENTQVLFIRSKHNNNNNRLCSRKCDVCGGGGHLNVNDDDDDVIQPH
ncbi:hypothetical protein DERP_006357 [Dermatophagoides pteronyssinus]|uniref:Uncharacterized protein n=1 Tax=Dermatophagoides pteronyssinus TaxID=6956 RepID=A0ABQ8IY72_DERPT|nr:hypothetical protein DERP_006357 [Dermatophagoides pteronyssinus]